MNEIILVKPSKTYLKEIEKFKQLFPYDENGIHGSSQLMFMDSVEEWLDAVERDSNKATVKKGYVPATQYIAIDTKTSEVVGMLNFRKELNDYLYQYAGHIGYSVAPSRRREGIGSKMLALALKEAPKFGISKVLITCIDSNLGSIGVIEKNGGILENKVIDPHDGELTRRYWITID